MKDVEASGTIPLAVITLYVEGKLTTEGTDDTETARSSAFLCASLRAFGG
jgi:hypothetical protein